MPSSRFSLLDIQSLTEKQIEEFFSLAISIKEKPRPPRQQGETLALLFFEPSTRTRMSFESAGYRAGLGPLVFDGGSRTSLEKGETVEDSIFNIAAMKPQFLVIRCGDEIDLKTLSQNLDLPILNAGWGVKGHPTQALLDGLTLQMHFSKLRGLRLLIVGDLRHSRVARSHFELAQKLGYEVGQCGPQDFLVPETQGPRFESLQDGLEWADAVMALRFQFERHQGLIPFSKEEYRLRFGIQSKALQILKKNGILLHPGPINHGIELETEVLGDSRSRVLAQVENGVYLREAVLRWMLGERP